MIHFQFDLRHIADHSGLHVTINDRAIDLAGHSSASRQNEGRLHKAVQHLKETIHPRFTHFTGLEEKALSRDTISWITVCRKAPPGIPLDTPILVAQYIPEDHLRAFYRRQFRMRREAAQIPASRRRRITGFPKLYSHKLHEWGLHELPPDENEAIDLLLSTQAFVDTMDTAVSLVAHHPALANLQPSTAALIKHYILPGSHNPRQTSDMQELAMSIKDKADWSPVIPCIAPNEKVMKAGYGLKDESGTAFEEGSPLYTYGLDESVLKVLAAPIAGALKTSANDHQLRNKTWTPAVGKTVKVTERDAPPSAETPPMLSAEAPKFKWTVTEQTHHYGVSVDPASVNIDENDKFSIKCTNGYSRTLFAGYRLKTGKDFGGIQELHSVNATNDIIGIPIPTLPTKLEFGLNGASEVELVMGSLGVGDWTDPVSSKGACLTAMWQYGVPTIFLVAGKLLKSTAEFRQILEDKELIKKVIIVVGTTGALGSAADYGDKKSFEMLSRFANLTFGIIMDKTVDKIGNWVLKKAGAGSMLKATGPVGWAMRAAAVAVSAERMLVTTGEVLASAATVRIRVSRAIDVSLTLLPDPKHGEAGKPETAVWPSVASRYLATLQYVDGTNRQLSGPLKATTNGDALSLLFSDVPAGGKFQIIAGVYSDTGWLAGSWQSGWMDSIPNHGTTLVMDKFSIVENLVPLSPDTHYQYKEEIRFASGQYQWAVGSPSQTTADALNRGPVSELVNISLNNSAYQVGFAWKASGQNLHENEISALRTNQPLYAVQNLSVLKDPGGRLISTEIGFTHPVRTAYAPSTLSHDEIDHARIDQHNFVLETSGHLRQVLLSENQTSFGFEKKQLSWGRFPPENVNALAVHPDNLVVACSFSDSKLMILKLPEHGCADDDAPKALMLSGEGDRQGLMNGPRAMAVAPDGSILVLESVNNRVQAFDRNGNPVPCFTSDDVLFDQLDTAGIAEDLDGGRLPELFHKRLVSSGTTWCAFIDGDLAASLNLGRFSANNDGVLAALAKEGVYISYDPDHRDKGDSNYLADEPQLIADEPLLNPRLHVDQPDRQWTLTDPRGQRYRLIKEGDDIDIHELPSHSQVEVQTSRKQWLITDRYLGKAWKLTPSLDEPGKTIVKEARSYFPIVQDVDRDNKAFSLTYLDMAAEAAGHVYVSYYRNVGSNPADYCLDVYTPHGRRLIRSPGNQKGGQNIVAGKFAVDIWRNLYALAFGPMPGPEDKVQPGIMHWTPTPPLCTLPLKAGDDLNARNVENVARDFAEQKVTLSGNFFIDPKIRNEYWEVTDRGYGVIYHLYRSGNGIEAYSIKAGAN